MMLKEKFYSEVKHVEDTMKKLSSFGADDTEPHTIFQNTIKFSFGKFIFTGLTSETWMLYDKDGVEQATLELNDVVSRFHSWLSNNKTDEMKRICKEYCWRSNWN